MQSSTERKLSLVDCNLCGADDFEIVFPKGYAQLHRIVRCKQCDLMYANPQELIDCERFLNNPVESDANDPGVAQYHRKQEIQIPDNLKALQMLNEMLPERGKLLEIGCFRGVFADRIREAGWEVTGLEPEIGPLHYAREKYGLNVVHGVLPHQELKPDTFDAVVLLHVIEHMPDPAANVREIRRLMKPGGVLVVETPRFDSFMFKILGRRERSMGNCNGHIYFFTVPTLTRLLEKSGFEVVRVDLVGRTLSADRFLYNLGVILKSEAVKSVLGKISQALKLDRMIFHVNVRDMQRVYCRAK
jgi:2-polyprenyl-3-methyl-5-hydroxy-6-metoxy-1,4-benzoquinol methylase